MTTAQRIFLLLVVAFDAIVLVGTLARLTRQEVRLTGWRVAAVLWAVKLAAGLLLLWSTW